MSSILCVPGLCSDCVASTGLFQGLCPRGAVSNYAKAVDVTVPQLNEEGDVIEMEGHNWGSNTKVYWKLLAFHGSCISVFGEEGGHGLGRQDSEFRVALLFSRSCFCLAPSWAVHKNQCLLSTFLHGREPAPLNSCLVLMRPPVTCVALRPGVMARLCSITRTQPFSQRIKGAAVRSSIFAGEHSIETTPVSALTRKFLHSRCSLPTLSVSVGLIAIVGTKLICLILWINAAFLPPWVTFPYLSFHQEEEDNLQAAYHDLKTDTIQLEERNVFCGSYNIRVLMDQWVDCPAAGPTAASENMSVPCDPSVRMYGWRRVSQHQC